MTVQIDIRERRAVTITDETTDEALNIIGDTEFILKNRCSGFGMRIGTSGGSPVGFDQFEVQVLICPGEDWFMIADAFGTPMVENNLMIFSKSRLHSLNHGEIGGAIFMNIPAIYAVRFLSAQMSSTALPVTRKLQIAVGITLSDR